MIMQLSLGQVQVAIADYLRKRGVIVDDAERIQLEIVRHDGARISIVGAIPVVIAYDVEFPPSDGPYRNAAAGALKP